MKFKTPAVAVAAFIAGAVAIPGVVSAQTSDPATPNETEVEAPSIPTADDDAPAESDGVMIDVEGLDGDFDFEAIEGDIQFYEPTAEEIAEWNAENQKVVDALRAAGIEVTVETDESGIEYFELPDDLTDAQEETLEQTLDDVFTEIYGEFDFAEGIELDDLSDFDFDELEDYEPTAEEIAEWNAETDELIEALRAAGVPVERMEEDGFVYFDIPEDLTEAQEAALEQVFDEHCEEAEALAADGSDDEETSA